MKSNVLAPPAGVCVPSVAVGATVSIVTPRPDETAPTFPARSVHCTLITRMPSSSGDVGVTW